MKVKGAALPKLAKQEFLVMECNGGYTVGIALQLVQQFSNNHNMLYLMN